jgi:hypothetical protein
MEKSRQRVPVAAAVRRDSRVQKMAAADAAATNNRQGGKVK